MPNAYAEDMDGLTQTLSDMADEVGKAVELATTALLEGDLSLAEQVISGDQVVDALQASAEQRAFVLLALHSPVAVDLRRVISALRIVSDLERAGDLAAHVAALARRRYPHHAVPESVRSTFAEMGRIAQRIMTKTARVLARPDLDLCREIERDDDEMDRLHLHLFHTLLGDQWQGSVEESIDITLCSRYYERLADHAVSVARRVVYHVTGERDAPSSSAD